MEHLDYLYFTPTVADINATNPKLWNTWRASLMRQLYTHARDVIRSGLGRPVDYQMLIEPSLQPVNYWSMTSLAEVEKSLARVGGMNILLKNLPMRLHGIPRRFYSTAITQSPWFYSAHIVMPQMMRCKSLLYP